MTNAQSAKAGEDQPMGLDVSAVRAAYPALADGYAYLDGAAGTQLPAAVIDIREQVRKDVDYRATVADLRA